MPRLRDINPDEVALVVRGANRRAFSIFKADDQVELDIDVAEVLVTKADGEDRLLKELADVDAAAAKAAVAAYRLLKAHADELPDPVRKAIDAMAGCADEDEVDDVELEKAAAADDVALVYELLSVSKADPGPSKAQRQEWAHTGVAMDDGSYYIRNRADLQNAIQAVGRGNSPHADIRAHIAKRAQALGATDLLPNDWNVNKEAPEMTDTATVPVKKEDGAWDLSGVPEELHEFMKAQLEKADQADTLSAEKDELAKAAEESKKAEEDALAIAKAEREIRLTKEYVAKAEAVGQDEDFGTVLKTIAAVVDKETFAKLDAVLKANHEQAVTAGLYREIGKSGGTSADSATAMLVQKADEIRRADSTLSNEQALAKAYDDNPDLYARMREEEQ